MVEERKEPDGPQDDKFLQLTDILGQLQTHAETIQAEDFVKKFGQRIELLNEVQTEVKEKCGELRAILERNMLASTNLHGCLRGDYLEQFDAYVAQLEAKIEADRHSWTREIKSQQKQQDSKLQLMKEEIEKFQAGLVKVYDATPVQFLYDSLKDLPFNGVQPDNSKIDFRWPKIEDLKALNLTGPLKLTQIRVKGRVNDDITAIQLVFRDGIESPLFECNNNSATGLKTYDVPDAPVMQILAQNNNNYTSKFTLTQKDVHQLTVFPEGTNRP